MFTLPVKYTTLFQYMTTMCTRYGGTMSGSDACPWHYLFISLIWFSPSVCGWCSCTLGPRDSPTSSPPYPGCAPPPSRSLSAAASPTNAQTDRQRQRKRAGKGDEQNETVAILHNDNRDAVYQAADIWRLTLTDLFHSAVEVTVNNNCNIFHGGECLIFEGNISEELKSKEKEKRFLWKTRLFVTIKYAILWITSHWSNYSSLRRLHLK